MAIDVGIHRPVINQIDIWGDNPGHRVTIKMQDRDDPRHSYGKLTIFATIDELREIAHRLSHVVAEYDAKVYANKEDGADIYVRPE